MTTDSVFAIFSTTKAITGTACLQLVEEGRLDLDAPAENYAPDIGKLQVLEGFDAAGKPQAAAAQAGRHHPDAAAAHGRLRLRLLQRELQSPGQGARPAQRDHRLEGGARTPLLFDPGDDWEYGSNIDWAGQVVEGITGKRLGEVMQERIFAPLGMTSTAFTLTPACARASPACTSARPTAR